MINGLGIRQILSISKSALSVPHRYPQIARQFLYYRKMPNDTRAPTPTSVMIEPIARCNLKCPECPVGRGDLGRTGEMKFEEFQAIWESFRGKIAHALLFNQGEPLLVSHFDKMVSLCSQTRSYTVTSTNGVLLSKNNWPERLVESGLSELIISIDGITQSTFEQYRIGGKLDTVIQGVQTIRKIRDSNKKKTPILTMQMLLAKTNENEWKSAEVFAHQIGCDGIVFKTMQLDRINDPQAKSFLPTNKALWRYNENEDGKLILRRKWNGCKRLWWHPVIHSDGELVPCCFDKQSEYSYGNVLKDGFEAVWNNASAQSFRKTFLDSKHPPFPMCENCTEGLWAVELLPRQLTRILSKTNRSI